MKNSPGSMIGGIGLTIWVRAVQVRRVIARTSSIWASSTPTRIVALDCLRKPPDECSRVARYSFSSRASTRAPASSLWTTATISFMARRIRAGSTSVESRPIAGPYNGPTDASGAPLRHQGDSSSMDRSTDTLATSAAALAHGGDLDKTLSALLGAAAAATGGPIAVAFLEDPDRPGLQLSASIGMTPEGDR